MLKHCLLKESDKYERLENGVPASALLNGKNYKAAGCQFGSGLSK